MDTLRQLLEPYKKIRRLPDGRWHPIDEVYRDYLQIGEHHRYEVKDNVLLVKYLFPSLHWRVVGRHELR